MMNPAAAAPPATVVHTVVDSAPVTGDRLVTPGARRDWGRLVVAVTARAVLYTILALMFWSAVPAAFGWTPTTVISGSMEPSISVGDVVVAMPSSTAELRKGRIVLVDDPDHAGRLRLHRIVGGTADGAIITKGDANANADSTAVQPEAVRGVAVLRTPLVGMPVVWIRQGDWGLVLATLVVVALLMALGRADRGILRHPDNGDVTVPSPARTTRLPRPSRSVLATVSAVLVLGIGLLTAGGSGAAFASSAVNAGNSFASSDYPCLDRAAVNSPFLFYSYNEETGTVAEDSSGNGRAGTLTTGATRASGSCATNASPVLNLNGSTGQVVTSTLLTAPNVFTIETWFKTSTTTGGKLIGFGTSRSGVSAQYDRHIYMTNAGKLAFGVYNSATTTVISPLPYNDGGWHLATATLSPRGLELYVDGRSVATSTASTTGEPMTGYWRIGYDSVNSWPSAPSSAHFSGSIDNTSVYATALTAAQIAANYARTR